MSNIKIEKLQAEIRILKNCHAGLMNDDEIDVILIYHMNYIVTFGIIETLLVYDVIQVEFFFSTFGTRSCSRAVPFETWKIAFLVASSVRFGRGRLISAATTVCEPCEMT
jgi:hypothetical protein